MTFQVDVSIHDLTSPVTLDVTIDESELEGLVGEERVEKIDEIMKEVVMEHIAIRWIQQESLVLR